jgi:hypothetical protein
MLRFNIRFNLCSPVTLALDCCSALPPEVGREQTSGGVKTAGSL